MADVQKVSRARRAAWGALFLAAVGMAAFAAGLFWSRSAQAADGAPKPATAAPKKKKERVIYPKRTDLDLEGAAIEGEIRNPGEFYFQHRPEEKFDSLVKRRKNFHREMLRDAVLGK
jgi:hypothetical protein